MCSAEDADSEGVEGRFYRVVTGTGRRAAGGRRTEPIPDGRGRGGQPAGSASPRRATSKAAPSCADRWAPPCRAPRRWSGAGTSCSRRAPPGSGPGLDDKVLTEWNAMYGSALAEAAAATGNPAWGEAAVAIGEFLCDHLLGDDGRWRRSWRSEGGARHLAYAADYAWLVDFFTRLGELTGQRTLDRAGRRGRRRPHRSVRRRPGRRVLHHRTATPRRSSCGPRTSSTAPPRRPTRWPPWPWPGWVRSPAPSATPPPPGEVVDHARELLARHPTAFAHTVLTALHLVEGWTEVVVTGDRPDLLATVARPMAARRRAGLGRADRLAAVAGPGGRPGLRVPELHLPAAGRRRRHPGRRSWLGHGLVVATEETR